MGKMGKDISSKNAVTTVTETILVNRPCRLMVLSLPAPRGVGQVSSAGKDKKPRVHRAQRRRCAAQMRR